jgi:hypothetical protein
MSTYENKRQSHGLTLPATPRSGDSVVGNILSSLATLDETAQLHWISDTSRQVDNERAYQRYEQSANGDRVPREDVYDRTYDENGYSVRGRSESLSVMSVAAPSPAVAMGRPAKQGFFRRFMGIGPKVPIEVDIIPPSKPRVLVKNSSNVQVRTAWVLLIDRCARFKRRKRYPSLLYQMSHDRIWSRRNPPASSDGDQRYITVNFIDCSLPAMEWQKALLHSRIKPPLLHYLQCHCQFKSQIAKWTADNILP